MTQTGSFEKPSSGNNYSQPDLARLEVNVTVTSRVYVTFLCHAIAPVYLSLPRPGRVSQEEEVPLRLWKWQIVKHDSVTARGK